MSSLFALAPYPDLLCDRHRLVSNPKKRRHKAPLIDVRAINLLRGVAAPMRQSEVYEGGSEQHQGGRLRCTCH
jgi:hypothetical protein